MAPPVPLNPPTRVNTTTAGDQVEAAVAAIPGGGFVVVWGDDARGDVFAQRYSAAGTPVGSEFQVNLTTTSGFQFIPSVAGLDSGFVAAWQSGVGTSGDILAQRFDANGLPVGPEITVTNAAGEQLDARVIGLAGGGFLATWGNSVSGSLQEVRGLIYDASGDPIGDPDHGSFLINTTTAGAEGLPAHAALPGGGFVSVWLSNASGDVDILAQLSDAVGDKVGGEFQVNLTDGGDQSGANVAALDGGGFVVTWVDPAPGNAGGQIRARRYDAAGNAIGGETIVHGKSAGHLSSTSVTALDGGGFLVGWIDGTNTQNTAIMARSYAADGTPAADAFQVNQSTTGLSVIISDGSATLSGGDVVLAWGGPGSGNFDVFFRHYQIPAESAPPVITSDGGGAGAARAVAENTTAVTIVTATDPDGPSLSFAIVGGADQHLFAIDSASGALSFIAAPDFEAPVDAGADNIYEVTVQASDGSLADTQAISVTVTDVAEAQTGPGDDTVDAPAGTTQIDGLGGIDTVRFAFALTAASFSWSGNQVIVDTPSSHTVLTGFERFVFTDGTVDNADSDRLVDDLFYFARNHDVWNARLDPEAHFHQSGWRESRDPNAFFDTSLYLDFNPDVRAAGVDPLLHFHDHGWQEGRIPSFAFDPRRYHDAYPDVAAAQLDPLEHFLRDGAQEGRQPFPADSLLRPGGFDAAFYLRNNPDVAAAGADPFLHFQSVGWREGRDPNALFDTSGYLATYADVAAAGVNPLDHYHAFGWREGRDPSVAFDTLAYLAAYADVAAADRDPLEHYLQFGIDEGRSAFADGVWG